MVLCEGSLGNPHSGIHPPVNGPRVRLSYPSHPQGHFIRPHYRRNPVGCQILYGARHSWYSLYIVGASLPAQPHWAL